MSICAQIQDLKAKIQQFRDVLNNPNRYCCDDDSEDSDFNPNPIIYRKSNERTKSAKVKSREPITTYKYQRICKENLDHSKKSDKIREDPCLSIEKQNKGKQKPIDSILRGYYYSNTTNPKSQITKKPVLFKIESSTSDFEEEDTEEEYSNNYSESEEESESEHSDREYTESDGESSTSYRENKQILKRKRSIKEIKSDSENSDSDSIKDNFVQALVDRSKQMAKDEMFDEDFEKDSVVVTRFLKPKKKSKLNINLIENSDINSESSNYSPKTRNNKKDSDSDSVDYEQVRKLMDLYASELNTDDSDNEEPFEFEQKKINKTSSKTQFKLKSHILQPKDDYSDSEFE